MEVGYAVDEMILKWAPSLQMNNLVEGAVPGKTVGARSHGTWPERILDAAVLRSGLGLRLGSRIELSVRDWGPDFGFGH